MNIPSQSLDFVTVHFEDGEPAEIDIKRILGSCNARLITALCWKALLPMRLAYQIQIRIGRVPHTKLVPAKNGTDYPLSEKEMQDYLDMFVG